MLEVLVHLDKSELPADYVVMAIQFDGRLVSKPSARVQSLIATFNPNVFQDLFYGFPVLRVPSVIVPREHNYICLPQARSFRAGIRWIEPLSFDVRLFPSLQ